MAKETICSVCGAALSSAAALCPGCGAPASIALAPKPGARRMALIAGGIVLLFIVVVLALVVPTFVAWHSHDNDSVSGAAPRAHLSDSGAAASEAGDTLAYAVADVESGSEKDRQALNGKTINVSGYLVVSTVDTQVISDEAAPKSVPRLTIEPAQPNLYIGQRARFTGVYEAASHTLKATAAVRLP